MSTSRGVLGGMLVLALALIASVLWLQWRGGEESADSRAHLLQDARSVAPPSHSSGPKLERGSDDESVPRVPVAKVSPSSDETSNGKISSDEKAQRQPAKSKVEPTGILVRVVDETNHAVGGVRVGLFATHADHLAQMPFAEGTSEQGTGLVELEDQKIRAAILPGVTLKAAVLLPLDPPVEAAIEKLPFEGEIRLVLPSSARKWLEPFRVQVVNASGEPVTHAWVAFRATRPDEPGATPRSLGNSYTQAPDGIAQVWTDKAAAALLHARQIGMNIDFEVTVDGPFADPPRAKIDIARASEELVRLVLPDTARVEVEVRGASGELVARGAEVTVEWRPLAAGKAVAFSGRAWQSEGATPGVAVFDHIGLDLELRIGAWLTDNSVERVYVERPGPERAGTVLRYALNLGARRPVLTGRVVNGAGAPVPGFRYSFSMNSGETDASGRFKIELVSAVRNVGATNADLEERPSPSLSAPPVWIPRYARFEMPARIDGGEVVDLGDVVLHDVPILVAGVVVDENGKPVNQAWLTFRYKHTPGEKSDWYMLNIGGPPRSTDKDGRFELRYLKELSEVRVGAYVTTIGASEELTVTRGTSGVRLVLQPIEKRLVGRILGNLLLDEGIPSNLLSTNYEHESGASSDGYVINGRFEFHNVPVGVCAVEIRTKDTNWLVERIEGVAVDQHAKSVDPRLVDIDLRTRLRFLRLRFVDESGTPLARDTVQITVAGEGDTLKTDEHGRFVALVRSSDDEIVVWAEGFEKAKVRYAPEEQEIVLVRRAR